MGSLLIVRGPRTGAGKGSPLQSPLPASCRVLAGACGHPGLEPKLLSTPPRKRVLRPGVFTAGYGPSWEDTQPTACFFSSPEPVALRGQQAEGFFFKDGKCLPGTCFQVLRWQDSSVLT